MVNDSIADLLTRIRNAQKARHKTVVVPASKVSSSILDVLKREGYIGSIENVTGAPSASGPKDAVGRPQYKIYLKYDRFGFRRSNSCRAKVHLVCGYTRVSVSCRL
jgi:ribosomal protein S8